MCIESTIHYGRGFDNALWNGRQIIYGDGDRKLFNRFTAALDVIGHELTHGVTQHSASLGYSGETGALNEHISDAFGILIKQYAVRQPARDADWVIGRGLFTTAVSGKGLRSLAAPGTAYDDAVLGRDPQPAHMRDYVVTSDDNGGVHINSGIPNHAFYLVASSAGTYAWDLAGRIWYRALNSGLRSNATFREFAEATIAAAAALCGRHQRVYRLVVDAWAAVGVFTAGSPAACIQVPLPQTRPAARGRLRWRRRSRGNRGPVMTVQAGFTDNNYQPSQTTARRPASRKENINMTTIPQNDTHLTFATIDSHVRAQAAMAPSQTKQSALDRLIARYGMIRPILVALEAIPLIPPAWRAGLVAFTTTADEVTLAFQAPVLIPDPANPDFKAGKDQ